MLSSPLLDALSQARVPSSTRELTPAERATLYGQGNRLEGAHVLAGPGFDTAEIWHSRFVGRVVLGGTVSHSTLEDSIVGEGAVVEYCPRVRRTWVGPRAVVCQSSLDCSAATTYAVGTTFKAGLETPGKEVAFWDAMTLNDALRYLKEPVLRAQVTALANAVRFDRTIVAAGARVVGAAHVDRVFLGEACVVEGALWLESTAVMSSAEEPARIGPGAQIRSSIVQWGAEVDSAAQVSGSILLEHSGAERRAMIADSLIGPNTRVGLGEVTASLVGPFVGLHHQSLLIAAWWPEGRGNIGSGASIGSNHTSRAPDQELRAGEGVFFGLAAAVKYPANFDDAPYSIIASGVVVPSQRLAMPFSLITNDDGNRVIPGWVYRENAYLLLRNEAKFLQRNKARRHSFDLRVFRPELVEKLWKARELLETIQGKPVYDGRDLPALGKNRLLEVDRLTGIETYTHALRYAVLRLHADARLRGIASDKPWLDAQIEKLGLAKQGKQRLLDWLDEERQLWKSALAAKRKDDARGAAVIPDFNEFHVPAPDDAFLSERAAELGALERKIQEIYRSKR